MLRLRGRKRVRGDGVDQAGSAAHAVRLVAVSKVYRSGGSAVPALDGVSVDLAGQSLVSVFLNVVLLGYIAIAVVNTLVLATVARSREFALLRLVGAHPRQVRRLMGAETAIVVLTAVAVGLLVALPPLVGVSLGITESPIPTIPPTALAGIVGVAALLGWASTRSRRGSPCGRGQRTPSAVRNDPGSTWP